MAEKDAWNCIEFIRQAGPSVYFLDGFDACKTPVLLVHGMGGTPRDWASVIDHLDRSRFQPRVYYCPSGMSSSSTP